MDMEMKKIASEEIRNRILALRPTNSYIEVNADDYSVYVIESNTENVYFLFFVSGYKGIALLEKYDFNNNAITYYGKYDCQNEDFGDLAENMGWETFIELHPTQKCEVVYKLLDKERTLELQDFNKSMEELYEALFPKAEIVKSEDDIQKYEEEKKLFIKSQRSKKAERELQL